jgi:hypothetical protein
VTVTHTGDLVSALLGVPGVAAAAVEPTDAGPGTLRLQLLPGADEVGVAGAVNRILRSRFGLAVDADRVRVLGETPDDAVGDAVGDAVADVVTEEPAQTDADRSGDTVELVQPAEPVAPVEAAEPVAPVEAAEPLPHDIKGPAPMDDADELLEVLRRSLSEPSDGSGPPELPRPSAAPAATDQRAAAAPVPPTRARPRLVIERVQLVSAGLSTSVTVVLAHDGRTVQGTADGTATAGSLHRSVAAATLRAVESVVGDGVRFDVDHVEVARTGTDRTALVVVTMVTDRATQRLSGASVVREDVRQAVIRAVLAAVNRRVEPLIATSEGAPA